MKTDPIRWVCALCLTVMRRALVGLQVTIPGNNQFDYTVKVVWPQCCGRDMLIAGEPKRDVHGLREKNAMIDPVDNLIGAAA